MSSTAKDTRFWDGMARRYAAQKLADPDAYERTLDHTRRYLKAEDAVVEFGCGTGTTALRLAPAVARMVATDISPEMIAIAREKAQAQNCANVEFVAATVVDTPGADASFDAAIAFNLLHLIEDRQAALANIRRLLKPGGLFMSKTVSVGDANPLYRIIVPVMQALGQAPYLAFVSKAQVEREITAAGFEIVERANHASRGKDVRPFLVARRI